MKTSLFLPFVALVLNGAFAFPTFTPEGATKVSNELRELVQTRLERRLLVDPLTTPIEGMVESSLSSRMGTLI